MKNTETFRDAVTRVLEWEFDRVIPGHGELIESGGKDAVRDGFQWILT
ncbi:hypothetical protein [Candidatus Halobonum tyrrellensis]|uniref:MBL fold metallo-hydrolase n=1 Tax=Candidatus Halobonum tyrrellensis G22 TaxID=1324957 RepID=V4IY13_9EURY|nr:hypothetical protein [Candidatus Halobonum tyrrellensis]ESP88052.1 hypothetical protein K933_10899 [Candidatus Halobonum tyrrellensis G22]